MIYGIASYKRPECRTVRTLLEAGVNKEDIVISTQCLEDYEEYKKRHGLETLYRETDCAGGNRNTIIQAFSGQDILLLDDDITGFVVHNGKRFLKNDLMFIEKVPWMFEFSKKNGATLFGISATTNNLIRRARYEYDFKVVLQGTVIGVVGGGARFDERFKMLEDYEISLRETKSGGLTMRFNDYSVYKPKNGTNEGGMHERYANGELKYWIDMLSRRYKEFLPNKDKTGGMAFFDRKEW